MAAFDEFSHIPAKQSVGQLVVPQVVEYSQ